jgi:dihydropteroate synthase
LPLNPPVIMGILNVTPDSFYSRSRVGDQTQLLERASQMVEQGAGILDIGGYSSRPGAADVSELEEMERVLPLLETLHKAWPDIPLSVDTWRSRVADEALRSGASIVNDISAGQLDPDLWDVVIRHQAPYILMHMQGTPSTMQHNPTYQHVTLDILDFFIDKLTRLRALGLHDIILDPGFGFGKSLEQNFTLLSDLHIFQLTGCPVLAGISRKSMITKALGIRPEEALSGTSALHMEALQQGASILRVHDVKEAVQVRTLWQLLPPIPQHG